MAQSANLLFEHTFEGSFGDPWGLGFSASGSVNNDSFGSPILDGKGHGVPATRAPYFEWRGKSYAAPGRANYQAELWAKWKNAAFSSRREVGLIVRMKGPADCVVARIRSMGSSAPELRLFKIVGGVETQLGATFTGGGLSATKLNAGARWRVRVEDLADGSDETKVDVYLFPTGPDAKGTLAHSWQGELGSLRGQWTVGVELNDTVGPTDVWVDDLRCYDLADEWNPSGPAAQPGAGWQLAIGGNLYSLSDLDDLDYPISIEEVEQSYGVRGNTASFRVKGTWGTGGLLSPGVEVAVYHDGDLRFRGWIEEGTRSSSGREQIWTACDGYYEARNVIIEQDSHDPVHWFNVVDEAAPEYDPDLQELTIGAVLKWLFDRYLDQLRFYGAAPEDGGVCYVQTELDELTGVITNLSVQGTFTAAIDTLLRYLGHRFMLWWDPSDRVWHFRDVTDLTAETVSTAAQHIQARIQPDRSKAATAVEWRGTAREKADDVTLSVSNGGLIPSWTPAQQAAYSKDKRRLTIRSFRVVGSGIAAAPDGVNRMYADVVKFRASDLDLDDDDVRGWVAAIGSEGYLWIVARNISGRIWFSPPTLGGAPPIANGATVTCTAQSKRALAVLGAAGVGRGYRLARPASICPAYRPQLGEFAQAGFCGTLEVTTPNTNGGGYATEEYAYNVRFPSAEQYAAGNCDIVLEVSERAKPSLGYIGYPPPQGSMPTPICERGSNQHVQPALDVSVNLPSLEELVPYGRVPEGEDEFSGPAYDKWNVRTIYPVNDSDFTLQEQWEDGRKDAAEHVLAVKSELPHLVDVTIASPWSTDSCLEYPGGTPTSTWAGLNKRVHISSAVTATGVTAADGVNLPLLGVTWKVRERQTVLRCGTANGFLSLNLIDISKAFSERRVLARALNEVKRLEDFRQKLLAKNADRIGGMPNGPVDACEVTHVDSSSRRVVSVQQKLDNTQEGMTHQAMRDWLSDSASQGAEPNMRGAEFAVPGQDGAAAGQFVEGPLARSLAEGRWPFTGPVPGHEGYGQYGGKIVTDASEDGRPPRELKRIPGYVFRRREDGAGNIAGSPGPEFAAVDEHGAPTGAWTPYDGPTSMPSGVWPLAALGAGSTQRQLLDRSRSLADRFLAVEDAIGQIARPGSEVGGVTVPADLLDLGLAGMLGDTYRVVRSSIGDPGGLVFEGPMRDGGPNAGTFWRVHPVAKVPVLVSDVGPGAGDAGGSWATDVSGPGGSMSYLAHGYIHDKQIHTGADFEVDASLAPGAGHAAGVAEPGHPFGVTGLLLHFHDTLVSGWVCTVPIPYGARGDMDVWVGLAEDPNAIVPAANTFDFAVYVATQGSPWGGATLVGSPQVVADGTQTAGQSFRYPAGYVAPGQRRVSISTRYNPGTGSGPGPGIYPVFVGAGISIAVVEGGYLLTIEQALAHDAEALAHAPFSLEGMAAGMALGFEPQLTLTPDLGMGVAVDVELNPPVVAFDRMAADLEVTLELNP